MIIRSEPYDHLWTYKCDHSVISVAATPSCSLICAVTVGRELHLINKKGECIWSESLDNEGWSTAISEDGNFIAVGTANKNPSEGSLTVYDRSKKKIFSERLLYPVWSVAFSQNGKFLVASTWGNKVVCYKYQKDAYVLLEEYTLKGSGLYGISISKDGEYCVVGSYDTGIYVFSDYFKKKKLIEFSNGIYNTASSTDNIFVAGTRDGKAIIFDENQIIRTTERISSRPICGIGVSSDQKIMVLGSFDGRIYVASTTGDILWDYSTDGEVWSTGISNDGSLVYLGSGDHTVRLLKNHCNSAAYAEISIAEKSIDNENRLMHNQFFDRLVELYLQYGIIDYGAKKLHKLSDSKNFSNEYLTKLYTCAISYNQNNCSSHYGLGEICDEKNELFDAAIHFQKAAEDPILRSKALSKAADCFSALGLKSAASMCLLRAREQHLDAEAKRILYNLGRSFEDVNCLVEAEKIYQLLLSWDVNYRDVYTRLIDIRHFSSAGYAQKSKREKGDYTGLTVNLLGPDTPRINEIDEALLDIITARTAENKIASTLKTSLEDIITELSSDKTYMGGIVGSNLDYSTETFLKYDYSLPEDEAKKFLETTNLLSLVDMGTVKVALDIGTATARYPSFFAKKGIKSFGIDIEEKAIEYAIKKINREFGDQPNIVNNIQLDVGDACDLQYDEDKFDLITCMMGTFAHIDKTNHSDVLQNMFRVLRSGGHTVISTWDVDCEHLSYLSMYSEKQKELIRKNSRHKDELCKLFEVNGFTDVTACSFALFPYMVIYGLDIQKLDQQDLSFAVQADIAARTMFSARHGEMYLVIGKKP